MCRVSKSQELDILQVVFMGGQRRRFVARPDTRFDSAAALWDCRIWGAKAILVVLHKAILVVTS